jgi:tRNA pseudouridine32 synthase/23S rRNA pseudouridine746 synthase
MLEILHQDQDVLAVAKPANLLCVPGLCTDDNLFDRVRQNWPNARVVHRLDMATSGIVLFALSHASQVALGRQFEQRRVTKRYSAVVEGRVLAQCGEIALPLICDWPNRPRQMVDWNQGRAAHTYFEVVQRAKDMTHLRLYPLTGRSHQLRVHCQQIGHPILGDSLYGNPTRSDRLMLHADFIRFFHPASQHPVQIECPAPFAPEACSLNTLSSSTAI